MTELGTTLWVTWIAVAVSNVLPLPGRRRDWDRAIERTYFQGVALFCVWFGPWFVKLVTK